MAASKTVPIATKSLVSCLIGNRSTSSLTKGTRFLASQRRCHQERSLSNVPLAKHDGDKEDKILGHARYGGRYTVTMLPGDGIGPEMTGYIREVFREVGAPIDFETVHLDPTTDNYDDLHNAITSVKRNGCAIKGNIESRINQPHIASRNVEMRNALDLFYNVVHCKSVEGIKTRHDNVDVVVVRQNTAGEYAMLEHENVPGVVESLKVVTEESTARLCRFAFDYARENGRKKVTVVHKANIMKLTDGLFLATGERVAREYPDIEFNQMIIDNCCMQLVSNPWQFDVVVLTNLYGTIVTNLLCGLIGGPGLTSGKNLGPKHAIFETGTRNTGSTMVGKNIANPTAMLRAGVDLLRHLDLESHADIIEKGINKTIIVDEIRTSDIGGSHGTSDVVNGVLKYVRENAK